MRAKITLFETTAGEYGRHGDTHWDAIPYWVYYPTYVVSVELEGCYKWGPFKHRADAQKTHAGTSRVHIKDGFAFVARCDQNDYRECNGSEQAAKENSKRRQLQLAEEKVLEVAGILENKGFQVEVDFAIDHQSRDLDSHKMEWLNDDVFTTPPTVFKNRYTYQLWDDRYSRIEPYK